MLLSIDTSLGTAVALVTAEGAAVATAHSADHLAHAEVIGDLLQQVLADAGATPGDVTAVVEGMGPGPFTGLRIGIAAARAFAVGRGIPVVPVPSHSAGALGVIDTDAPRGAFAIVTDARRREVAVSIFDGLDADGIPAQQGETVLVPRAELQLDVPVFEVTELSAADLGRIGARALAAGRTLAGTEPLYLRSPDVVMPGPLKKVGA